MWLKRVANGLAKSGVTSDLLISSSCDFVNGSLLDISAQHLGVAVCFGHFENKACVAVAKGLELKEEQIKQWMADESLDKEIDSNVSAKDIVLRVVKKLPDSFHTLDSLNDDKTEKVTCSLFCKRFSLCTQYTHEEVRKMVEKLPTPKDHREVTVQFSGVDLICRLSLYHQFLWGYTGVIGNAHPSRLVQSLQKSDATLLFLSVVQLFQCTNALESEFAKGFLAKWNLPLENAVKYGSGSEKGWKKWLLAANWIVYDTLFFPVYLAKVYGKRIERIAVIGTVLTDRQQYMYCGMQCPVETISIQ